MKDIYNFLFGVIVGALLGLLFAPQSGAELRANIQSTAEKDKRRLQEQWQVQMAKIQARLDQMESEGEQEPPQVEAGSEAVEAA